MVAKVTMPCSYIRACMGKCAEVKSSHGRHGRMQMQIRAKQKIKNTGWDGMGWDGGVRVGLGQQQKKGIKRDQGQACLSFSLGLFVVGVVFVVA